LTAADAGFSRLLFATSFSWWEDGHDTLDFQPALAGLSRWPLGKLKPRSVAMSAHVFHEIYLHFNWHTKGDSPLLRPDLEAAVHDFLAERCRQTKGVYFHAIGGTVTHVHLAINIEPQICISDLMGDLKGACSYEINQQKRFKALEWQRGFGVVSFGKKQLPWVKDYLARQKEHHQSGRVQPRLEKVTSDDDGSPLDETA
jgi:putative transposase